MTNTTIEKTEEMNKNKNLPQGWVECKLGDILYLRNGYAYCSKDYSDDGISLIRISDIKDNKINLEKTVKIPQKLVNESCLAEKGDFLIAMSGATTGKTGTYEHDSPSLQNQRVGNLKFYTPKYSNYKYRDYFVLNKRQHIEKIAYGGAQPNISKQMIEDIALLLPPLVEQERIVDKIEELFSDIDAGVKNLEQAKLQIKQYRQSVLKSAFDGKLYKTTEWQTCKISDVANVGTGGTPLKSNNKYYSGDIAWVTSGALNSQYVEEATDYITELALKETNVKVYPKHTLLVAMYGEGKTRGMCSELLIEAGTNQAIAAIQINNPCLNKDYLKNFMFNNYNNIRRESMGGVQPNLNLTKIKNIYFPLPTIHEQQKIVEEIEKRFEIADILEQAVDEGLEKAKQLKQSILKKAFEGKLVPQNPADEPASILLKKIKAEKYNYNKEK